MERPKSPEEIRQAQEAAARRANELLFGGASDAAPELLQSGTPEPAQPADPESSEPAADHMFADEIRDLKLARAAGRLSRDQFAKKLDALNRINAAADKLAELKKARAKNEISKDEFAPLKAKIEAVSVVEEPDTLESLKRKRARGEITREEFEQRKSALEPAPTSAVIEAPDTLESLKRERARGNITREEFERRKAALEGAGPEPIPPAPKPTPREPIREPEPRVVEPTPEPAPGGAEETVDASTAEQEEKIARRRKYETELARLEKLDDEGKISRKDLKRRYALLGAQEVSPDFKASAIEQKLEDENISDNLREELQEALKIFKKEEYFAEPGLREKAVETVKNLRKEAKEILQKFSKEDLEKVGSGLLNIGFLAEEWKNRGFARLFKKLNEKAYNNEPSTADKWKAGAGRFFSSLQKNYEKDAERARKKREGKEGRGITDFAQNIGYAVKIARLPFDLVGVLPMRAILWGGWALHRTGEAIKEARLGNEAVMARTRIGGTLENQNPESAEMQEAIAQAAEEAWEIYRQATERAGGRTPDRNLWGVDNQEFQEAMQENLAAGLLPTKEDLEKAYLQNIPRETMRRMSGHLREAGFLTGLATSLAEMPMLYSQGYLRERISRIERNQKLSSAEKKKKKDRLLQRYEKVLKDWDRIVTQAGTVDAVALGAKYAELAGKAMVGISIAATLEKGIEKIWMKLPDLWTWNGEITPPAKAPEPKAAPAPARPAPPVSEAPKPPAVPEAPKAPAPTYEAKPAPAPQASEPVRTAPKPPTVEAPKLPVVSEPAKPALPLREKITPNVSRPAGTAELLLRPSKPEAVVPSGGKVETLTPTPTPTVEPPKFSSQLYLQPELPKLEEEKIPQPTNAENTPPAEPSVTPKAETTETSTRAPDTAYPSTDEYETAYRGGEYRYDRGPDHETPQDAADAKVEPELREFDVGKFDTPYGSIVEAQLNQKVFEFNPEEYQLIRKVSVGKLLQEIPADEEGRIKLWKNFTRQPPDLPHTEMRILGGYYEGELRKQMRLAEYIRSLSPTPEAQKLSVAEFINKNTSEETLMRLLGLTK